MLKIKLLFATMLFVTTILAQPSTEGYYLDGVDDYINVPFTTNINSTTTNNRTYEMYFKVTSTSSRQIIFKEGAGVRAVFAYVEGGYLIMGAYNRADYTPQWQGTFYRKAISANTWYHFALVFDNALPGNATTNPMTASANNALKWYLDGVLQTQISGYQLGGHNSLRIGYKNEGLRFPTCGTWTSSGLSEYCFGTITNDGGGNEYYFQGNVWGFRVWNDVRTPAEIDDNKDVLITSVGTADLVAALDGDTLTYLDSSDTAVTTSGTNITEITWSATAASTDWNTGSNWVGGSPPDFAKLESAIIPTSTNYPAISSHIEVGRLEVQSGASITVNAGGTLDANYGLTNNGTITVENDGSLIYRENKAVEGTGTFTVERDSPSYTNAYFYSYWSNPLEEADVTIATVFPNVGGYDYYWDASSSPASWQNDHTTMEVGRGYAFRANQTGVVSATFSGTVNNGDVDETVYFTSYDSTEFGFNIIGNPYPSAINWEKFQSDNSDIIEGTVYYWRQTEAPIGDNLASDYIEYNSTGSNPLGAADGNIASASGFAVQAKTGGGTVTFKNTHRVVANNTQFFRTASSTSATDGRVSIKLSGNGFYATMLLGFLPEGTTSYDDRYDGEFINEGANVELYSLLGTQKLGIQALPELLDTDVVVPVGFETTSGADYTFAIDQQYIDTAFDIILEDRNLGVFTDLKITDYTFNLSGAEEDNDRFFLHFENRSVLSTDDIETLDDDTYAYFKADELRIKTNNTNFTTLALYDSTGRQLYNAQYADALSFPRLNNGMYVVKLGTAEGNTVVKKIVK